MLLCNEGCDWRALGDGVCNPQCNTSACFWDRQDCAAGATGCTADCHPDWIVTAAAGFEPHQRMGKTRG